MEWKVVSECVLYSGEKIAVVRRVDIEDLKKRAIESSRGKARICAHPDASDPLHEMMIVHNWNAYVRPHKHPGKSESVHMIEGEVDVVFFDESGKLARIVSLGDYRSGKCFFYRIAEPVYHTLIMRSDAVVFHEVTNGPFNPDKTIFASWAPAESDPVAVNRFQENLEENMRQFLSGHPPASPLS
jgi:cupin fold WbuC family metalloprotein